MRRRLPAGPPYPAAVQAIGFWTRPLASLERWRARYGKRFTMRLPFSPPLVLHSEPGSVKEIYTAPPHVLHPGEGARILEPVVGPNSVILLDRDAHMEQRKLLLPAFHGERMERLEELVREVADREIAAWSGEREIALHPRMQRLTLEIILRAVFGVDPGERMDALRERLATVLAFGDRPVSLTPMPPPWLQPLLERVPPFASFVRVQQQTDTLIAELIAERRAEGEKRDDVLSMLLEARHEDGSHMSPQELRDELMTMLVAGHETTASALAWAFVQLTANPTALARLRAEGEAGEEDAYLIATIQETLRHRPVLPNTAPRLVKEPIAIGGHRYEPGVAVVANAYLLHHDSDVYPDPYRFRPERFLESPPGTYTWIPFGGGRRRCIGASFALMEMRIVLRAVLEAYTVAAAAGPEPARRRNITIRPAGGSRVKLTQPALV